MDIPINSIELIELLDKKYPNRHPRLEMTDREIWYEAGRRAVVDNLLHMITEKQTEALPRIFKQKDK